MLDTFAPSAVKRVDLWEMVAASLRRAIITGELGNGVHLQEPSLAQKFRVSRVPVREALARLEHEGLVRSEHGRGAFVVGMTSHDVREVYELRELLETRAARLAAERCMADDLGDLAALVDRMAAVVAQFRYAEATDWDIAFHRRVIVASRHARMLAAWEPVAGVIATLLSVTNTSHPDMPGSVVSHSAILDALRGGSPDAAEAAMSRHLQNGERVMQAALQRLAAQTESLPARSSLHPDRT